MGDTHVEIEIGRPKPRWYVNFADFANMVKAFIGSNYLYVAFAFSQSGLYLGIVGIFIIAFLTDHCCHLIVKTKHHGINRMMDKRRRNPNDNTRQQNNYSISKNTVGDSGVDDEDDGYGDDESAPCIQQNDSDSEDNSDFEFVNHAEVHEHITKNMSYGDVGKLAYGNIGVGIVNFCIGLTQFGFCVNYFIFIGNTIHSLFPVELCYNNNETLQRICDTIHDSDVKSVNFTLTRSVPFIQDNSIYSADSLYSEDSLIDNISSTLAPVITTVLPNMTTVLPNVTTILPNVTTMLPNTTTLEPNMTTLGPVTNATVSWTIIRELEYTAPDLKILVACPLLVFILFALIRNVRYLGVISVIANMSILFGCVSVLAFLLLDFKVSDSIVKFRIEGFPVFFGMVTGAFEGIGLFGHEYLTFSLLAAIVSAFATSADKDQPAHPCLWLWSALFAIQSVIPVESSMVGNRHLFSAFLHGAILFLTTVLGCFGILGYLKYGKDVHQMLNTNIPSGNPISMAVNLGICIGILLTFPLQIFPVIEIMEKYLFSEGRICGPSKEPERKGEGENEALMPADKDTEPLLDEPHVVAHVPDSVPAWKRNVLRITIVVLAGGLAIILKDNFAYVGAFVGAVGSSVLAFILPCLFHLRLCWHEINVFIKLKDILIVVFGVFASIISVVSVVERIVKHVDVG